MSSTIAANIEMLESTAELFKSFSDPHRLGIMIQLIDQERSVGELANALSSSISAVSHQLKQLRLARLVSKEEKVNLFFTHYMTIILNS